MSRKRIFFYAGATALVLAFAWYIFIIKDLPTLSTIQDYQPNLVSNVYSRDGQIIGEFYIERRVVVPLNKIPRHLINAFLAAEDSKFYEHEGVSYTSILRAFYKNLVAGRIVQGGSTITQQLARSFFLTSERKISRKVREVILAYRIEKQLDKDGILNLYLNQIYFGNGAYGIQTAAEAYFGKDVEDLDLAESSMLAGLPKAPSKYSPFVNYELSKKRQQFVLGRMVEEGYITEETAEKAFNRKIKLRPKEIKSLWVGPYFTEHVRRYIEEKYGDDVLYKGGLQIQTTLDVDVQKAANAAVRDGLRAYDRRRGYRGPLMTLKTDEEIEAFRAEWDIRLQDEPLEDAGIYQGVIMEVNLKNKSLKVDIGSVHGTIEWPDHDWAKLSNTSNDPDGGKVEKFEKLFNRGDVVEVMVKALPYDRTLSIPLRLEQPPLIEAGLVAMDQATGFVRAMIGGNDFAKTQFNRAVQALRQPGSAFKPIIYAAAVDNGYTPASIVMDSPLIFEDKEKEESWRPRNYDEQFYGPTTVRDAIARSRNVITVKILKDIGVEHALSYARQLGLTAPLANDLSLALGSSAVNLLELTTAYATFANLGIRPEPLFVVKITDKEGNLLEENVPVSTVALSPQTAYIMTSLLEGVVEHGTGQRAKALGRPAAGKTGTTNNLNDAWFLGYVPGLTAGVWVGYDDEQQLGKGETGAMAALPIWVKFMGGALGGTAIRDFPIPEGLEFAKIDPETGLLATASTETPVFEIFKAGTAPTEVSKARATDSDFLIMETGGVRPSVRKDTMR